MSLKNTNLLLEIGQLDPTFRGTPAQLVREIIRRAKIVSPSGTNFIFIGDVEPTSNVGPWLKGGTSWWVFDEETKRYVPADISDSETRWYSIGASTPTTIDPPVWFRTERDATEADPSYGDTIEILTWNGSAWKSITRDGLSGTTAERLAITSPINYQQFYDTDLTVLLWFERSAWRTVAGVPGDVKAVSFPTLTEALARNPGWEVLGANNQSIRGRYISQAAKNSDGTGALTVSTDVAVRAAFETFGESDGVTIDNASPVPYPPTLALWHLVKT